MITTYGGDPNVAYRIARALQKNYKGGTVYAFIDAVCASAGTLLILGADELILSDHAELGPLDVQILKNDELGVRASGLIPLHALEYLETSALEMFQDYFYNLRFYRGFPTAVSVKISTDLTIGLFGRLYEQMDPARIAEVNRLVQIAKEYGTRIAKNLKSGALEKLLQGYPSHDFSIDSLEAAELFKRISFPKPSLAELGAFLKPKAEKFLSSGVTHAAFLHLPPDTTTKPDEFYDEAQSNIRADNAVEPLPAASNPSEATPSIPPKIPRRAANPSVHRSGS